MAHLKSEGKTAKGKAIWVIKGTNVRIENIEFSGAKVRDQNGGGIRQQGTNLTIVNCYFHDNQTGILTTDNKNSEIVIEGSRFERNGHRGGSAHNLYIGVVKSFTLRGSYIAAARIGSNVKSRALVNNILYNRIVDEDGRVNYGIDLSNGGIANIIGNVIQQNERTENSNMLAFGPEMKKWHQTHKLVVVNNTFVNERSAGAFIWNRTPVEGLVANNLMIGRGKVKGKLRTVHNVRVNSVVTGSASSSVLDDQLSLGSAGEATDMLIDRLGVKNVDTGDYQLAERSPVVDYGAAVAELDLGGLAPEFEYVHPAALRQRKVSGHLDVGAYEWVP